MFKETASRLSFSSETILTLALAPIRDAPA
jgi:hypothetical protein